MTLTQLARTDEPASIAPAPTRPKESCPRCGTLHEVGPHIRKEREGQLIWEPADVSCVCGATLRCVVPIFSITASGYRWEVI